MPNNTLFISLVELDDEKNGVSKKIKAQLDSLMKYSETTEYTYVKNNNVYLKANHREDKFLFSMTRIGFANAALLYRSLLKNIDFLSRVNTVYVRHSSNSINSYLFFRKLKKQKCKVCVEIVTYPYKNELKSLKSRIAYYVKEVFNLLAQLHIDRIITFSEYKEIWHTPCINIANGVDLMKVKIVKKQEANAIRFTSVSSCFYWHGIDRFIDSLIDYYNKHTDGPIVQFNIVGSGGEVSRLKEVVEKNPKIYSHVKFHGYQSENQLDDIFNNTDIAVGSLGRHRSGLYTMRTLKNTEYAAKGLPMIYSEDDPGFREADFVYKISPNEDTIDLDKILGWYNDLTINSTEIREYSKQFSWNNQILKVLEEVEAIDLAP